MFPKARFLKLNINSQNGNQSAIFVHCCVDDSSAFIYYKTIIVVSWSEILGVLGCYFYELLWHPVHQGEMQIERMKTIWFYGKFKG